jgi:hypothetical protein
VYFLNTKKVIKRICKITKNLIISIAIRERLNMIKKLKNKKIKVNSIPLVTSFFIDEKIRMIIYTKK